MAGTAAGLGLSSLFAREDLPVLVVVGAVGAGSLSAGFRLVKTGSPRAGRVLAICAVGLGCLVAGAIGGGLRIASIEQGAISAPRGSTVRVSGVVEQWARESDGRSLSVISSPDGRFALRTESPPLPNVGEIVTARGVVSQTDPWRADWFRRYGVKVVVEAEALHPTGRRRSGLGGVVDGIRMRAEAALGFGIERTEAALARGFVLGADQEIPPRTVSEFRGSGLAHLLAVSGQNVVLLSVLAWPMFALAGLRLNGRLVGTAALIAIYVLVTGAGPSILRAGVMGGAALVAALAGRPSTRLHALFLAAAVTLSINPLSVGDPGWLLSFAATAGILLWSRGLAELLGARSQQSALAGALREAAAVTVAATLATAPLGLALFGTLALSSIPANLAAAPAVAPVMWIGMVIAMLGQVPGIPLGPLSGLNALGIGYIEWVAHLFGSPSWSLWRAPDFADPVAEAVAVLGCWIVSHLCIRWLTDFARRRRGLQVASAGERTGRLIPAAAAGACVVAIVAGFLQGSGAAAEGSNLTLCALDVGQGDSILIDPPGSGAALIDAGPPGVDLAGMLRERGVEELSALILTHDQSDHAGGASELLRSMPVARVIHSDLGPELVRLAEYEGADLQAVSEGSEVRLDGNLDLSVLWPPSAPLAQRGPDPNRRAIVLLVRWRHFTALLTADAESEATPVDPGPVDLLKVAHHGSEDGGLDHLLEHSVPKLAVISVGEGNSYGHPTPQTLRSLSSHSVPVLRTDLGGSVGAEVDRAGWRAGRC